MPKKIFICAGEASGDMYGSHLVKEIKQLYPDAVFTGIGGERMKEAGVRTYFGLSSLAYMGVLEVLRHYIRFRNIFNSLVRAARLEKPDLAILIDYPSFNLRLAKKLNQAGVPIVYYISPQIWAWGKKRIHTIKKLVRKIIVIFNFEEAIYKKAGVDVEFVGHPLLDTARPKSTRSDFLRLLGLDEDKVTIALLPGSRKKEVEHLLPVMMDTADIIHKEMPNTQFALAKYSDLPARLFDSILKKHDIPVAAADDRVHDILNAADFAIVKSGTGTLEAAIMATPMIIVYRTSFLTALVSKLTIRLPYVGMVNVMSGKKIVPEFLQYDVRPKNMADEVLDILKHKGKYESIKQDLVKIKGMLGQAGASRRAANIIAEILEGSDRRP